MTYGEYVDRQYYTYANDFEAPHAKALVGGLNLIPDADAVNKSAYLVAWRFPKEVSIHIEDTSLGVNAIAKAVVYGTENAHTTLSNHLLMARQPDDPNQEPDEEILENLSKAVYLGLDTAGRHSRKDMGVVYNSYRTSDRDTVALGLPTRGLYEVCTSVRAASTRPGLGLLNSKLYSGLLGSQTVHMTVSHNMHPQEPAVAQQVAEFLESQKPIGYAEPAAIEVGHYNIDTENGFQYTAHTRFELQ
ncbi:MAG TPA: hypothetical protein VLE73_04730 [Candidatus Saccharimonadales bacterium]|nr:hypothetical protein [Candidatus Saccharimonadales bacterium]